MAVIHLIERLNNLKLINRNRHEWESGYWVVSENTAQCLVGGELYIHDGKLEPSHFGGTILGYRVQQGGEFDGRVVFRFRATMEHKGVRTDRKGWGNEKKLLGCDGAATARRAVEDAVKDAQATGEAPKDS